MHIGSGSHVGIPTAGLGGRLTFPPWDQFSVPVVFLTILSIVVGIRTPVLLSTVAVHLALPGLGRGGALLLWDAIPVAALGLEVVAFAATFLAFLCARSSLLSDARFLVSLSCLIPPR